MSDKEDARLTVRIKDGAPIFQDHRGFKWPNCYAPGGGTQADRADMLFVATQWGERGWVCRASGFGGGMYGVPGEYGNGSIHVMGLDEVEIVGPESHYHGEHPAQLAPKPAAPELPKTPSFWLHHSGTQYLLTDIANQGATKPDWPLTAIYCDADKRVWARPLADFLAACRPDPVTP